jgi:hypothetical protein
MNPTNPTNWHVKMIDVLYAVVLSRGMFDFATNLGLPHDYSNVKSPAFLLFVFTVAVIARDWINYHELVGETKTGYPMFIFDILILFAFFFMLRAADPSPSLTDSEYKIFASIWAGYCFLLILWDIAFPAPSEAPSDAVPAHTSMWASELPWNVLFFLVAAGWALLAGFDCCNAASFCGAAVAMAAATVTSIVKYRFTGRP